jgi:hypothetical protein
MGFRSRGVIIEQLLRELGPEAEPCESAVDRATPAWRSSVSPEVVLAHSRSAYPAAQTAGASPSGTRRL